MAPGAFSPIHILIVLTVALLVLGPKELPKVVRGGAKIMRDLRALRARLDEELHSMLDEDDAEHGREVPVDDVPMGEVPTGEVPPHDVAMHDVPTHEAPARGVEHEV
jgi:Sec-independent protein translocase protein TatA